jgi:hypothetical protein
MSEKQRQRQGERGLALYHVVYPEEGFRESAQKLFGLVKYAQSTHPGKERHLFLDIEGHRNGRGGFDADMLDLHKFVVDFLMKYLCEASFPLGGIKNKGRQCDDVPEKLVILEKPPP